MTESQFLPLNFAGIAEAEFSSFENSRILVWPISYEATVSYGAGTGQGAAAIIDASRNMEQYDDETDTEVYKLGIHTLGESPSIDPPERMMSSVYDRAKELVSSNKFITMIGGEHSVSAPVTVRTRRYSSTSPRPCGADSGATQRYLPRWSWAGAPQRRSCGSASSPVRRS